MRGFTLIELLLVIGIIGVLSSVVIVAINPSAALERAEDAERRSMVKELGNAMTQYLIDGGTIDLPTVKSAAKDICQEGVEGDACTVEVEGVDLAFIPPSYLPIIPVDPDQLGSEISGYRIYKEAYFIKVCSPVLDPTCGGPYSAGQPSSEESEPASSASSASSSSTGGSASEGAGCTPDYSIASCSELSNTRCDLDGDYTLTQSFSCAAFGNFTPIGDSSNPFTGTLNGGGYVVSGLTVSMTAYYAGLFGDVNGGTIQNIGLTSVSITSTNDEVGALIGYGHGGCTVSNAYSTGTVSGRSKVGGLIGEGPCSITSSYSSATVTATTGMAGGLVGLYAGSITDSYATGTVSTGGYDAGGLVGQAALAGDSISNSYATGNVSSDTNAGGLVGTNRGSITDSYATGSTSADSYVGGLVGFNEGTIARSSSTGDSSGDTFVGGLVGILVTGSIANSYATGDATSTDSDAGGLVGQTTAGTITNCYSIGVPAGSTYIGGFIGANPGITVTSSYWDTQTSGKGTSEGGTGKTTAQMKQQATFSGWDFTTIWQISEGTTYPTLR